MGIIFKEKNNIPLTRLLISGNNTFNILSTINQILIILKLLTIRLMVYLFPTQFHTIKFRISLNRIKICKIYIYSLASSILKLF